MRHASTHGPYRLRRVTQPAVDALLGRPVLDLRRRSAARIHRPTTDRKHGLVQVDGRLQKEHSTYHYPYIIGTVQNRHRGSLSRSGSDVLDQELSRYPRVVAWPAGGRTDDTYQMMPLQLPGIAAAKAASRHAVVSCHHMKHPSAARVVVHYLAEEVALLSGAARGRKALRNRPATATHQQRDKSDPRESCLVACSGKLRQVHLRR